MVTSQTHGSRFNVHGAEDEDNIVDEFTDAEKVHGIATHKHTQKTYYIT